MQPIRSRIAPVLWSFALLSNAVGAATPPLAVETDHREATRNFFNALFFASEDVAMGWTGGSIAGCKPGTIGADFQAASLLRINLFRALAGVPAGIVLDDAFSVQAQAAALMMSAKNTLSHTPKQDDPHWPCLTDTGDAAAGKSNLSLGHAGPAAVFGQMQDQGGNNAAVGHRRWLLYPQTQQMGVGDVAGDGTSAHESANAVWVQDGHFGDPRPATRQDFVSWPPPGFLPYPLMFPRWSFSLADAKFDAAKVSVTRDGVGVPVTLEKVAEGSGENTLVFKPNDPAIGDPTPAPAGDIRFDVKVEKVKLAGAELPPFTYSVTLFDPARYDTDTVLPDISGPDHPVAGQAAVYDILGTVPGADGYEWLQAPPSPYATVQSAESGTDPDVETHTTLGYNFVTDEFAADGSHAYVLRHFRPEAQTLTLKKLFLPGAAARLNFQSRLGRASAFEVAKVQYSLDGGQAWHDLYIQAGQQDGSVPVENGFSPRSIDLDSLAGRPLRIRFRYDLAAPGAGAFTTPSSGDAVGWYIDAVAFEDMEALDPVAIASAEAGPGFSFTGAAPGALVLAGRGTLSGQPLEWGPVKVVRVFSSGANQTPVADAGPAQTATVNTLVTLDGSRSLDPDHSPAALRYQWIQQSGPNAPLAAANTAHPSFTPAATGTYVFALKVDDTQATSAAATVAIKVIPPNQAPIADAGPDQQGVVGKPVTLDGGASHDPDNGPKSLVYLWQQDAGPIAVKLDPVAQPSFATQVAGSYAFHLKVNDGALDSAVDTVNVTVRESDQAPTANAGPDRSVVLGSTVTLDGSQSRDPDNGPSPLSYAWEAPNGVVLGGANTAHPSFKPTQLGTYGFRLTVSDGVAAYKSSDTVTITVTNAAPVANAGPDRSVLLGSTVTLDGSQSRDPDNAPNPLKYLWEAPPGSNIALTGADTPHPSFKADQVGRFEFSLTVDDGNQKNFDMVKINVTNAAPVANAGPDQSVPLGSTVILDGGQSRDPDNVPGPLQYQWQAPQGSGVALTGADTAHPSFTPTQPGSYEFGLIVTDGNLQNLDKVIVTVTNQTPVANAGPDIGTETGATVTLDGSASADPDHAPGPLAYHWLVPTGIVLNGSETAHPSFVPNEPGTYSFGLVVDDGAAQSATDAVTVTVSPPPPLRLLSPQPGAGLKAKQKQAVTWQSNGIAGSIKLTLSLSKNGVKWTKLATPKNTGRYTWKVAKAQAGAAVRLRLCAPAKLPLNGPHCDETDGPFTVSR